MCAVRVFSSLFRCKQLKTVFLYLLPLLTIQIEEFRCFLMTTNTTNFKGFIVSPSTIFQYSLNCSDIVLQSNEILHGYGPRFSYYLKPAIFIKKFLSRSLEDRLQQRGLNFDYIKLNNLIFVEQF